MGTMGKPQSLDWDIAEVSALNHAEVVQLRVLWRQDPFASPFGSPSFLEVLIARARSESKRAILARGFSCDGELSAVWPLKIDRAGRLEFLQNYQGDHCTCLAAKGIEEAELGEGLAKVLQTVRPSRVFFSRVPPWGYTLAALRQGLAQAGWWYTAFPATPCPILDFSDKVDADQELPIEINRHKRLRNYENRMRRQSGYEFQVCESAEGIDDWATAFFDAHEWRWNRTGTPSACRFASYRKFLLDCLHSWAKDNVLVRFSIQLNQRGLAFVAGLRANERLVYHLVVSSPAGEAYRAGHVLIRLIGLWMSRQGLCVLDFGVGDESYKLRYANKDDRLWRLHGTRKIVSTTYVQAQVEKAIRLSPQLQSLWDRWRNQWIRGKVLQQFRDLRSKWCVLRRTHLNAPWSVLVGRLKNRVVGEEEIFYRAKGGDSTDDPEVVELSSFGVLEMYEEEFGLVDAQRAEVYEFVHNGAKPFGIMCNGRVIHVSWLSRISSQGLPTWLVEKNETIWIIQRMVTAKSARGCGIFPHVLKALLNKIPHGQPVLIYTYTWNSAARRGIVKAGFKPVALRITKRNSKVPVYQPMCPDTGGSITLN